MLHAAENEIISYSLGPAVVLVPVDSEGKPVRELLVRSTAYSAFISSLLNICLHSRHW